MKFASTFLQALIVAQTLTYGAAKGSKGGYGKGYMDGGKGYMDGKGKGSVNGKGTDSSGKGYSPSSVSGKGGKGSYSPSSDDKDKEKCEGSLKLLQDTLKVVGDGVIDDVGGGGAGTRLLFANNILSAEDEAIGKVSGVCTFLPGDSDSTYCLVTIEVDEVGSIAHQGLQDNLIITGGSGCYEGVVGSASLVMIDLDATAFPAFTWELDVDVDAKFL